MRCELVHGQHTEKLKSRVPRLPAQGLKTLATGDRLACFMLYFGGAEMPKPIILKSSHPHRGVGSPVLG